MLKAAIETVPDTRDRGSDLFPPLLLSQLRASVEEEATLPMQQIFNVIALLDKPGGGRRPIALMGMLHHVVVDPKTVRSRLGSRISRSLGQNGRRFSRGS